MIFFLPLTWSLELEGTITQAFSMILSRLSSMVSSSKSLSRYSTTAWHVSQVPHVAATSTLSCTIGFCSTAVSCGMAATLGLQRPSSVQTSLGSIFITNMSKIWSPCSSMKSIHISATVDGSWAHMKSIIRFSCSWNSRTIILFGYLFKAVQSNLAFGTVDYTSVIPRYYCSGFVYQADPWRIRTWCTRLLEDPFSAQLPSPQQAFLPQGCWWILLELYLQINIKQTVNNESSHSYWNLLKLWRLAEESFF